MHESKSISNEAKAKYHGIFAKLSDLNLYEANSDQVYGPELADFYNRFVADFTGDIPIFQRFLLSPSARTLDLACGSGRIGIGLARLGYTVDGLDLSPDMLALADQNLSSEPEAVKQRVSFALGDMTDFSLPHRYDLIVIGVTSISLLLTEQERMNLFTAVRKHLLPSGKLIFDFLNLEGDLWKEHDHHLDIWSAETDEGLDFAIVGQRFFPEERTFTFNVYRERVGWDGATQRAIGSSTKAWLSADELIESMRMCGLQTTDRLEISPMIYLVAEVADKEPRSE
jgi:SAM-dependent methyltransferase